MALECILFPFSPFSRKKEGNEEGWRGKRNKPLTCVITRRKTYWCSGMDVLCVTNKHLRSILRQTFFHNEWGGERGKCGNWEGERGEIERERERGNREIEGGGNRERNDEREESWKDSLMRAKMKFIWWRCESLEILNNLSMSSSSFVHPPEPNFTSSFSSFPLWRDSSNEDEIARGRQNQRETVRSVTFNQMSNLSLKPWIFVSRSKECIFAFCVYGFKCAMRRGMKKVADEDTEGKTTTKMSQTRVNWRKEEKEKESQVSMPWKTDSFR